MSPVDIFYAIVALATALVIGGLLVVTSKKHDASLTCCGPAYDPSQNVGDYGEPL